MVVNSRLNEDFKKIKFWTPTRLGRKAVDQGSNKAIIELYKEAIKSLGRKLVKDSSNEIVLQGATETSDQCSIDDRTKFERWVSLK